MAELVEDLKVGDWITVLSWEPGPTRIVAGEPLTDSSYVGELLEVLAVDLPFVAVIVDEERHVENMSPISLDLRRAQVQKCSAEFVKAMKWKSG
jgi:hypothetical protein